MCASRRRSRRPILAEFVQGWSSDLRPLGHHLIKGHCQFCEFVAVTQAMQPLLGEAPAARIVNVSSGVGSLTRNSDSTYAYHSAFGPVYPASRRPSMLLRSLWRLSWSRSGSRSTPSRHVSPKRTSTLRARKLSRRTLARRCRVALLGPDGPAGMFTRWENEIIP